MATPLVPDGVYKIRNAEFTRSVTFLIYGRPARVIVGEYDDDSDSGKWLIKNVGKGGNQVIIESVTIPWIHATQQVGDKRVVPSEELTVWTLVKVDHGKFNIQTEDGKLVWELPTGNDSEPILLVPQTGKENTKWLFQPI